MRCVLIYYVLQVGNRKESSSDLCVCTRVLSVESGRFDFHYPLNLFRKLVDSTRTIYNIPTAICSSMEMATCYFGFTCYFLAVCLVGAGYQPSACYLPAICLLSACYLPAICLFRAGYLLFACLFGLSGLSI